MRLLFFVFLITTVFLKFGSSQDTLLVHLNCVSSSIDSISVKEILGVSYLEVNKPHENYAVIGFRMIYHQPESKDAFPFHQFGSNEMTPKMKSIISKCIAGDFFFFSNIKVLDRDFKVYNSASFAIIIKN